MDDVDADRRINNALVPLWSAAAFYAVGVYALFGRVAGAVVTVLLFAIMWQFAWDFLNLAPVRQPGGLSQEDIDAIPAFEHHRPAEEAAEQQLCAVCISVVQDGETVKRLPACGHMFHAGCLDRWLRARATCPVCRAGVAIAVAGECGRRRSTTGQQ